MPKDRIISFIDYFYPLFRKLMPLQTFRYAACGGANTLLGLFLQIFLFSIILEKKQEVHIGIFAFKGYSFTLFFSSCVTFTVGFLLNKYVVFIASNLKGRIQLFRYFLSSLFSILISYICMKILVEIIHLKVTIAQVVTTIFVVTTSYFSQLYFTFKVKEEE